MPGRPRTRSTIAWQTPGTPAVPRPDRAGGGCSLDRDERRAVADYRAHDRVRFARLFAVNGTVFAAVEIQAVPFVAEHFLNACFEIGRLADELDDDLQEQFGGRTAFGEFRSKPTLH